MSGLFKYGFLENRDSSSLIAPQNDKPVPLLFKEGLGVVNINPSEPPLEKGRNIYCHPELFGRACPELVEGLRINSVKNLGLYKGLPTIGCGTEQ